ncbi:isoprenylcysteine carboxylmethyltransferase family protein [uncultured Rhodospira sp.]|uniref:methyltransferase family protein n=1 Tax=uncultured Rhodospira sp. TaxID=1936189 RepID=UPI00261EF1A8|nr:isoprenylcysteine carboxylmethyltransferase family protein [uncultured Rhodospira sp.]
MTDPGQSGRRGPNPPQVSSLVLATMIVSWFLWPGPVLVPWPWTLVGALVMAAGLAFAGWAVLRFQRVGTNVHPHGEATVLVTDGPFARSRNPMYLSIVITFVGVAILMGTVTPWVGPVIMAVWLDWFIRREERHLLDAFGGDYDSYRSRVRRWI